MLLLLGLSFIVPSTSASSPKFWEVCRVLYSSFSYPQLSLSDQCAIRNGTWNAVVAVILPNANVSETWNQSQFDLISLFDSSTAECLQFVLHYIIGAFLMEITVGASCGDMHKLSFKIRQRFSLKSRAPMEIYVNRLKPEIYCLPTSDSIDLTFIVNSFMIVATEYGQMLLLPSEPDHLTIDQEIRDRIESRFDIQLNYSRAVNEKLENCSCDTIGYYNEWMTNCSTLNGDATVVDYDLEELNPKGATEERASFNPGMLLLAMVVGALTVVIIKVMRVLKKRSSVNGS